MSDNFFCSQFFASFLFFFLFYYLHFTSLKMENDCSRFFLISFSFYRRLLLLTHNNHHHHHSLYSSIYSVYIYTYMSVYIMTMAPFEFDWKVIVRKIFMFWLIIVENLMSCGMSIISFYIVVVTFCFLRKLSSAFCLCFDRMGLGYSEIKLEY